MVYNPLERRAEIGSPAKVISAFVAKFKPEATYFAGGRLTARGSFTPGPRFEPIERAPDSPSGARFRVLGLRPRTVILHRRRSASSKPFVASEARTNRW
jgi:hypothetical protein